MRKLYLFLLILGFGIIQAGWLGRFKVFSVAPELLFICMLLGALSFNLRWALIYAVACGSFLDLFSPLTFGINTLIFAFLAYAVHRVSRIISFEEKIVRLGLAFTASFFYNIAYGALNLYLARPVPPGIFLRLVILGPLISTLVFPLISRITLWKE